MTEFSGVAGRMSNNQSPQEGDDERSLMYPADDDTTADDEAAANDQVEGDPVEREAGGPAADQ